MSWKKLQARTSKKDTTPALSIQKNGRVAWNLGTHEKLGEPEYVELLLDIEGKRLGVRKVKKTEDAFAVRQTGKQKSWGISAMGALSSEGITVEAAYRKFAQVEDNVVFINIDEILGDF